MFWGLILKPNQVYNLDFTRSKILHISHASLVDPGDSEKVMIHLKNKSLQCVLGILTKGRKEFLKLDYFISNDEESRELNQLSLSSGVNCEVHLTGYFIEQKDEEYSVRISQHSFNENYHESNNKEMKEKTDDCEEIDDQVDLKNLDTFLKRKRNNLNNDKDNKEVFPQKLVKMEFNGKKKIDKKIENLKEK